MYIQPFRASLEQYIDQYNNTELSSETQELSKKRPKKLAYIVGIVPAEKNFMEKISLPMGRINMFFFAVLIIILLTPHLKLILSGSHFMPSRAFVLWLMVSFPLLTIVLIIGALSAYDYFKLTQSLDDSAKEIGGKIASNFHNEFGQLNLLFRPRSNTGKLEADLVDTDQKGLIEDLVDKAQKGLIEDGSSMFLCEKDHPSKDIKDIMLQPQETRYPEFDLAFYLDSEGQQTGRQITYRPFPANNIKVDKRDYFKRPTHHSESLLTWPDKLKYFSERINTYDHGKKMTALSFPVESIPETKCNKPSVLAIIKLMHTFFQPVMPIDFGFAVIKDASGEVLYHSNDHRSIFENFYVETDQNTNLIAAVQMRHAQLVSGKYDGIAHGFWVTPLSNTSWSLIVFYDKELMELANFKASIFALVYSGAIVFPISIVFALFSYLFHNLPQYFIKFAPNEKFWALKRKSFSFLDKNFDKVFINFSVCLLLILFGTLAAIVFSCEKDEQGKKLVKFNLLHIGKSLIVRQKALNTEIHRLTERKNISTEETQYLNVDLFNFANYASHPHVCCSIKSDISSWFTCNSLQVNHRNISKVSPMPIEIVAPEISAKDSLFRLMEHNNATDESWSFHEHKKKLTAYFINENNNSYFKLNNEAFYTSTKLKSSSIPYWWYLYLFLVFLFLYALVKLTSNRLLGLGLPEQAYWRNLISKYSSDNSGFLLADASSLENGIANRNLLQIANDNSGRLLELKSILFNRSHNQYINYNNLIPIMELILGGILKQENGSLDFSDQEMKEWVRNQPWDIEISEYQAQQHNNPWSIIAPAFYAVLLLAIAFLVLSGGQVGELMLTMVPIIFTGGIPFFSKLIEKKVGSI